MASDIVVGKVVASAAAAYLLYVGITCPCEPNLYSCHVTNLYVALLLYVAVIVYFNGARVTNY